MTIRRPDGLLEERLSYSVIGAFFAVHRQLGFGFLESVYSRALEAELRERRHRVSREFAAAVHYSGLEIAHQRLDMVVDEKLVVEIKATDRLHPDGCRQLFNYLRATSLEVGLLLHFGRSADFYRVICQNHLKPRSSRSRSPSDS